MTGPYGQVISVTGWTAQVFESWEDDDPADRMEGIPIPEETTDGSVLHDWYLPEGVWIDPYIIN